MKAMLREVDDDSHALLAMAASSGDKDTFNAVLAAVTEELGQKEVNQTININITQHLVLLFSRSTL